MENCNVQLQRKKHKLNIIFHFQNRDVQCYAEINKSIVFLHIYLIFPVLLRYNVGTYCGMFSK